MVNRFKQPILRKTFAALATDCHDNFSTLYLSPKVTRRDRPGPNAPYRSGSGVHHAFWNGFASDRPCTIEGSISYAAFKAGVAFRKELNA